MPAPTSTAELIDLVRKSGLYEGDTFDNRLGDLPRLPEQPVSTATLLVKHGLITKFQAKLLLLGKYRGFRIGPYTIKEQIGQGGMGAVYLAEHNTLRRKVALKVLTPGPDADQKIAVERFMREARSAAALDHPNIVRLHDVGQFGTSHYLVMEYVEGETLDNLVRKGSTIPCGKAVEYIAQAAAGLQHAYEKGFVHRDIKPANLILSTDGTIKILDMGLARSSDERDKLTANIDVGAIVGTADYISPEQAVNDPKIDIRADIYSLGATFYSLVTGRPPFSGNTTQKLVQHQVKDAPSLTRLDKTLPKELAEVVSKMMSKKKELRYRTPADVIAALSAWLPNSGKVVAGLTQTEAGASGHETMDQIVASKTKSLTKSIKRAIGEDQKKLYLLVGSAAAGVLIVGTLIGWLIFGGSKSDVAKESSSPPQNNQYANSNGNNGASPKVNNNNRPKGTNGAKGNNPSFGKLPGTVVSFVPKDFIGMSFGVDGYDVTSGSRPNLPPIIALHCWKPGSKGEFRGELFEGRPTIRLASRNEPCSAQFRFDVENEGGSPLKEGKEYEFRVTYQMQGSQKGRLTLMTSKFDYLGGSEMPPGESGWQTASVVGRREQLSLCCAINAEGVSEEGFITVAAVEVIDIEASKTAVKTLYSLNFEGMKPGTKQIMKNSSGDNRFQIASQQLPKEFMLNQFDRSSSGEYVLASIDGTMALGMRHLEGSTGTQVNIAVEDDQRLPLGQTAIARITYQIRSNFMGSTSFELNKEPYTKQCTVKLPPTGSKWATVELPFDRPDDNEKYTLIINPGNTIHSDRKDATLWIKSIDVVIPGVAPANAEAVQPVDTGSIVYDLPIKTWKPFRFTAEGYNYASGDRANLPNGVALHSWKPKAMGQFVLADSGDGPAITLTNLNEAAAQLLVQLEYELMMKLEVGKKYAIRLDYRTMNDGAGHVMLQTDDYANLSQIKLEDTAGAWSTKDIPFTRLEGKPVRITVNSMGIGEGNVISVRRLTVYEVK